VEESRELLRLRESRWRRFERRRSRRGGDCEDAEPALDVRLKSWKLRRGEEGGRVSWVVDERWALSVWSEGPVIISWVCVSERINLNSGGGGLGAVSVNSSRLWRMFRSDGISIRWSGSGVGSY